MHVIPARQQVQNRAVPLKSDVMALLGLMRKIKNKRENREKEKKLIGCVGDKSIINSPIRKRGW